MHPLINKHPAQEVMDSSKIKTAQTCLRRFFFEHRLGWRPDLPNIHLEAGVAVHLACEHLCLAHKETGKIEIGDIATAYTKFLTHYRLFFPEDTDAKHSPKDPNNILVLLTELGSRKLPEYLNGCQVLYTEVGGTQVIGEKPVAFKIDLVLRGPRGIVVTDFKTASQDSIAGRSQYTLSTQVGMYIHAIDSVFGGKEQVYGADILQFVLRKQGNAINEIPIVKTPEGMLNWLFTTEYWMNLIEWNDRQLDECKETDTIMQAFPQNPESCTKYGLCPFHAYCTAWGNPLQRCAEPPTGFRVEHWDPLSVQRTVKSTIVGNEIVDNPTAEEARAEELEKKLQGYESKTVNPDILYKGLF